MSNAELRKNARSSFLKLATLHFATVRNSMTDRPIIDVSKLVMLLSTDRL